MGFSEVLSKILKREDVTKAADKIEQDSKVENQTTEGLTTHDWDPASGEGINSLVQLTESTQKEEINLEEVETKVELKTQESTPSNEQVTKEKILEVLSDVYDPEIPIDIVNLGLIYDVEIIEDGNVHVKMTMTAPGCPSSAQIAAESQMLIEGLRGVKEATIEIVWDPPWDPSRMSEDAKRGLGYL